MWTSLFWKDAAERALKTFAQAVLAILLVAPTTSLLALDWPTTLGVAATGAAISVLTSIVSAAVTSRTATVSPASIAPDSRGL